MNEMNLVIYLCLSKIPSGITYLFEFKFRSLKLISYQKDVSSLSKKIKIEPEEKSEIRSEIKMTPTMQLLSKASTTASVQSTQSSTNQLKKSNITSFIKKKSEAPSAPTTSNEKSTPTASSLNAAEKSSATLLSLMSSYGSDSSESD